MQYASRSVTIMRPRAEVYAFWRALEHLPTFMYHLEAVTTTGGDRSHWVAKGPGGSRVEWDADIVQDKEGEVIGWQSTGNADVPNGGVVRFEDAPADRGTVVRVELYYDPPAGKAGALVASLFGKEPSQQLRDDLRRFKQVMETGEVVLSEGSLEGAGEGILRERPARAPEGEVRS